MHAFSLPRSSGAYVRHKLAEFLNSIGSSQVLVRSDGNREERDYPRGGQTLGYERALEEIEYFISLERAIILLEPTNRLSNIYSINISLDEGMKWTAEALSCGFDTSDLQRGLVTPEWRWSGYFDKIDAWQKDSFRQIEGGLVNTATHKERIAQRLESIADLFKFGHSKAGTERARLMLIESKNTCLFNYDRPRLSKHELVRVIEDAHLIASSLGRSSLPFTLANAHLADHRRIYWDISFGKSKWLF